MTMTTCSIRFVMIAALLSVSGLTACGAREDAESDPSSVLELTQAEMIESGREAVEMQCTACHAMGADDQSPRADAPPLKTVLANYAPEALATDFREHIHVGHPDMPDFDFGPIGTDHVLAYLESIQVTPVDGE